MRDSDKTPEEQAGSRSIMRERAASLASIADACVAEADEQEQAAARLRERAIRLRDEADVYEKSAMLSDTLREDCSPMITTTVHVAIGNSDNRLTQEQWSEFYAAVDRLVDEFQDAHQFKVYGRWVSPSTARYQNAAWAFEGGWPHSGEVLASMIDALRGIAKTFRQDSIAWNESPATMITPR